MKIFSNKEEVDVSCVQDYLYRNSNTLLPETKVAFGKMIETI